MNGSRKRGPRGSLDSVDPLVAEGLAFLGLTSYEIRVYDAILRNPQSRVPEIARESRVPQPKVYSTVRRLLERGCGSRQRSRPVWPSSTSVSSLFP